LDHIHRFRVSGTVGVWVLESSVDVLVNEEVAVGCVAIARRRQWLRVACFRCARNGFGLHPARQTRISAKNKQSFLFICPSYFRTLSVRSNKKDASILSRMPLFQTENNRKSLSTF
jgi:hypothetical protein